MAMCRYINCDEQQKPTGLVSFFRLPTDGRRAIWLKHGSASHTKDIPNKFLMCEKHFHDKDITTQAFRKTLSRYALPRTANSSICSCTENTMDNLCVRLMEATTPAQKEKTSTVTSVPTTHYQFKTPRPLPQFSSSLPVKRPCPTSPSTSTIPCSPNVPLKNLAAISKKTYIKDLSLADVSMSVSISESQFPSPHLYTYQSTPKKTPQRSRIPLPRRIADLDTPKRLKNDPEYNLEKNLDIHMDNRKCSEELRTFILAQLFHKPKGKWAPKERDLFLKMHYKSPASYKYLLEVGFIMPATNTIQKWHGEIRLPTGLSEAMQTLLTEKATKMTDMDKKCVLLFDEMVISKELEYNIRDNIIYGYTDFGAFGRIETIASKVMVFTLRGLNRNWKQSIAYYVGSPKSDEITQMLVEIMMGVIKCGLTLVATSCDQAASNRVAYANLKPNLEENPFVVIDNHKVFLLYDYVHLFKSVRNIMLTNKINIGTDDGKISDVIDWNILRQLYEADSKSMNMKVCFKLTEAHIKPAPFDKLNVKLATQIFSDNVSSGILCALNAGVFKTDNDRKNAASMAAFLKRMNDLFDTFNTGQLYSRNPNKQVVSDFTETLEVVTEARHWIAHWYSTGQTMRPPCFIGLKQTLMAIEMMWRYLRSAEQSYILLSHLNSDVAENVFSMVRNNRGSYERNPSAWRFIRNLKLIMFQNMSSAKHSGYQDAGAKALLQGANIEQLKEVGPKEDKKNEEEEEEDEEEKRKQKEEEEDYKIVAPVEDNINKNKLQYTVELEENEDADEEEMESNKKIQVVECQQKQPDSNAKDICSEKLQKAAAVYYAGFAAGKLKKKLNCEVCSEYMIDDVNKVREETFLIQLRAYKTTSTTSEFGNLVVPSIRFEKTVRDFQEIFEAEFQANQTRENIADAWLSDIMNKHANIINVNCSMEHKKSIGKFLLIGLITLTIRKINKDLKSKEESRKKKETARKANKKPAKFIST